MSKFTRKSAAAPVAAIFTALTGRTLRLEDGAMVDADDMGDDMLPHGDLSAEIGAPEGTLSEQFIIFANPDGSAALLPNPRALPVAAAIVEWDEVTGLEGDAMPLVRNNPLAVSLMVPRI
jgi:hypothetical protein